MIEDSSSHKPLTIWQGSMNSPETSWSQIPGVDIDQVAASISLQSDRTKKHLNNVLQNIQTRKSKSMDPVYVESNSVGNFNHSGNQTNNINNLGSGNINLGSNKSTSSSTGTDSSSNFGCNSSPDSSISRLKLNSSIKNSPLGSVTNSPSRTSSQNVGNSNQKFNNYSSNNSSPTVKQQYV